MTSPALSRPPRELDYRTLADFRYEIRRFLRFSEDAARAEGLEPQHHQLLLAIKGAPPDQDATVSYLAERLQIHHNSAVGLIDRLVAHRLVTRARDVSDRRRALIRLTRQGEAVLRRLSLAHQEELQSRAHALVTALRPLTRSTGARR